MSEGGGAARPWSVALTVAGILALCAVSAVLAVIGSFLSPSLVSALVAFVGNLAVGVLGAWGMNNRFVPAATGAVWIVIVLILGSKGPGGDLVVQQNSTGIAFLVIGVLAIALAVGLVTGRRWAAWSAAGAPLRALNPRRGTPERDAAAEAGSERLHPGPEQADESERDHARRGRS